MDKPQQHSPSDDSSESASSAVGCSPAQSGAGGFVSSLKQKGRSIFIDRTLDAEIAKCRKDVQERLELIRENQARGASAAISKKFFAGSLNSKINKRTKGGKARRRTQSKWLNQTIKAPYVSPLDKVLSSVINIGAASAGALLAVRRMIMPTEYERMLARRDQLQINEELAQACQVLIKQTERKQRALEINAQKLKSDAQRIARSAARRKDRKHPKIEKSAELTAKANAAQIELEEFKKLQLTRIPQLKERLKIFEALCVTLRSELHESQVELNAHTSKRLDELMVRSRAAMDDFNRMEQKINSRVEPAFWPKIRRKCFDWLELYYLTRFEKTVLSREQKAEESTAQLARTANGHRGLFPDLFERLESSVTSREAKAKESADALSKVPAVALADMSEAQLRNELNILTEIESSLKSKRDELEASVLAIQEEVIETRNINDAWAGRLKLWQGDNFQTKMIKAKCDVYSAQVTEFVDSMKLLETELLRMDCRIEVVQEECERVRSLLQALSSSSSSSS